MQPRDYAGILFAVGLVVLVVVVAVALRPLLQRLGVLKERDQDATETIDESRPSSRIPTVQKKACIICKKSDATLRPYKWVRDDGVIDLVRRFFGAPATLRVARDTWKDEVLCESCDPMVKARFIRHHALDVADTADFRSKLERRRARFETQGWIEEVKADVLEHNREMMPNNVVPFTGSTQTGTEE